MKATWAHVEKNTIDFYCGKVRMKLKSVSTLSAGFVFATTAISLYCDSSFVFIFTISIVSPSGSIFGSSGV